MAMFVHLGDERDSASYRRAGLKIGRFGGFDQPGVFAMPVLPNYYASHQWLRELKRRGVRTFVGVYFRVGDGEPVTVGHFGKAHQTLTAVEATRVVREAADPRGFEVVIPRKILAGEIHAIRSVSQVVGWRYFPEAHGRKPCGCPFCQKGQIRSKGLREAFERFQRGDT